MGFACATPDQEPLPTPRAVLHAPLLPLLLQVLLKQHVAALQEKKNVGVGKNK